MVTAGTVRLLRWHAGLDGDAFDARSVSGSLAGGHGVDDALTRLIETIQALNQELNGERPSDVVDGDLAVPRDAAYAVAEAARMLRDGGHVDAAWAVDMAWLAVLAGDIDDIGEHV